MELHGQPHATRKATPPQLVPIEKAAGWALTAGLDVSKKRKISCPLPGFEPRIAPSVSWVSISTEPCRLLLPVRIIYGVLWVSAAGLYVH